MKNKNINVSFGGFGTLLGIAFIILKLCKVITWSWVWVLSPIWISFALGLIIFIVYILLYMHFNP